MIDALAENSPRDKCFIFPEKLVGLQRLLPYALLLSITFALYGVTLFYSLVWDDDIYVLQNFLIQNLSSQKILRIWTTPFYSNYAPLHQMLLGFIFRFSGVEPFGYHLAQLLLHGACVCLLYLVLKQIEGARVALLASLMFAAYPGNIETVAWVSETKSTLSFALFLASFWFFIRFRDSERWTTGVLSALLLIFSLLAKISTVVASAVYLFYDIRQGINPWKKRWSHALFFLISAASVLLHLLAVRDTASTTADRLIDSVLRAPGEAPLPVSHSYYGGFVTHLLNMPRLVAFYERMILYPHPITIWHMIPIRGHWNWAVAGAWLLLVVTLLLLLLSPRDIQFWGAWFLLFLAPVLQIIPNQIWVADRYLYIPAVAAFVLLSKLLFFFFDHAGSVAAKASLTALMVCIPIFYAWQTRAQVPAWKDNISLWEHALSNCATSAFCHSVLGSVLISNQESRGLGELIRSVQIRPTAEYLIKLGDVYTVRFGNYADAHRAFQQAQALANGTSQGLLASAARTYYMEGNYAAASGLIDLGLQRNPRNSRLLIVRGFLRWKTGQLNQARADLQLAIRINAENPLAAHPARFISFAWDRPAEVGQLLHDLGGL